MKRSSAVSFALALLVLLASCTGPAVPTDPVPTPTPEVSPTPTQVETPPFALSCYPEAGFHPITGTNRTNLQLAGLIYQGLFALDSTFTPQKQLCSDYTVTEDGLSWRFTLAQATFSDGSPFTAADAAYSLDLARSAASGYAARFHNVRAVTANADNTLSISLYTPNGNLPALLDVPIVKEAGDTLPPLGTGDYALERSGEDWLLRRVTALPASSAAPASIPLLSIRQTDDLIYGFDTRRISLVAADLTGTNTLGFSGSLETWDYPTSTLLYLGFNTVSGPCAGQELRQALSYGIDRSTIATSLFSRHARAAALPVSPASPLYDAALAATLAYSHSAMEERLEQAGWLLQDGLRTREREPLSLVLVVNMENSYKLAVADLIADSFTRAGIAVEVRRLTWDAYTAALSTGAFDLYLAETRMTADFDPSALVKTGGALNYGGFSDGETDLLLSAFLAAGEEERSAAASALWSHLAQEAPLVPICFKNGSVLTHWGSFTGLTPTQQNLFYGFDRWG